MMKLRPRPDTSANLTTKMFSGDVLLSDRKLCGNESASLYVGSFRMRSAAAMAAWQAFWLPIDTGMHELFAVGLTPVCLSNTPAFRYMLARMASIAPFVMRPGSRAGPGTA